MGTLHLDKRLTESMLGIGNEHVQEHVNEDIVLYIEVTEGCVGIVNQRGWPRIKQCCM